MISVEARDKYKDFYNYLLLVRGVRESSATFYIQKVEVLLRITPELSAPLLNDTLANLKSQGAKGSYLNQLLVVARVYGDYLKHKGQRVDQGIYSIKKLKEEAIVRATMSDSEIERFLTLPPPRGGAKVLKGYTRWNLFFSIMAFTGMRPKEVATLTIDTVDIGRGVFIVTEAMSKTHSQRYVPIPPNISNELEKYLKTCDKWLFPAMSGRTHSFQEPVVDSVDWGYNFHSRCKRLGIARKGLCPYSLRHSFCTRLLETDGVNLFHVQKIMGHKRLETTQIYNHLTTVDIQRAITKHPLIRKATDPMQILDAFKEIIRSFEFDKNKKFKFSLNEESNKLSVNITIL